MTSGLSVLLGFVAAAVAVPIGLAYFTARRTERENRQGFTGLSPPFVPEIRLARFLSAALCYVLSLPGFLMGAALVITQLLQLGWASLLAVLYAFAWLCHLNMCFCWIENRYMSRRWALLAFAAIIGTLLAFSSRLVWPSVWKTYVWGIYPGMLVLEIVLVFPALVLAVYVATFHLMRPMPPATTTKGLPPRSGGLAARHRSAKIELHVFNLNDEEGSRNECYDRWRGSGKERVRRLRSRWGRAAD